MKFMALEKIEGGNFIDLDYFEELVVRALIKLHFDKFRKSHYKKRRIKNYRRIY